MINKTKRNFWLDVIIFVSFVITATTGFLVWQIIPHELGIAFLRFPRSVWVTFHICSGMVSLAGVITHVAWHWNWLKALRGHPLSGMAKKVRTNRITDRVMWITFIAANAFGALAWVMHFDNDIYVVTFPDCLHALVGIGLIFLVTVHLALHGKWIAFTIQHYIQANLQRTNGFQSQRNI